MTKLKAVMGSLLNRFHHGFSPSGHCQYTLYFDQSTVDFAQNKRGDWASSETKKVVLAALTGQVETLFVLEDATLWGVYNEQLYELEIYQASTPETKDLLTEAAIKTIQDGGKVYQCAAEDMPEEDTVVAALFRNPVTI